MAADEFHLFSTLRYDPQLTDVPQQGPQHAGWNYDNKSPIYMLDHHRDRLLKAASHWGWERAVQTLEGPAGLESLADGLEDFVGPDQSSPLRLKILVDRHGQVTFEKADTPRVPIRQLFPTRLPAPRERPHSPGGEPPKVQAQCYALVLDGAKTVRSEYTHFKTTHRPMYDGARQRANISPADLKEVLTVSPDGSVMEASITTPYFWRKGRWVTPPVSDGYSDIDGSGGQEGTSRRWALER
ncbi:4-amino-4-deoxychorismate lyase [Geosmithia morbida]|uniref:4-amino-4-deoxychorismate lyase n=1 Tax=Geosmithia morbida TaxID=1094350 RepID=A0A9P4Z1R3_9HYPO|nr:4-amino-4-deoxychorismate lyase [Geosmithia morbida]KAF4125683.1 4-amino-4-deoxychorismate lyase [Geosmithia morbida]